jgi:hypothetical protein
MAPRSFMAILLLCLGGSVHAADDLILLGGKADDAQSMTLKGSAATSASTVEVFHGRLLACLCHKRWGYSAPVVAYSTGCWGNGCYGYGCYGYGCQGYNGQGYSPGYPAPASSGPAPTAYGTAIAPGYSPSAPAMGVYGAPRPVVPPATTGVTVSTPRASFSLSLGNGLIIGRSALETGRLTGLTDQPIDAPPSERMPRFVDRAESLPTPRARPGQTFRYDGGPASPVPMPTTAPSPAPDAPRPGAPANRVKLSPKGKLAYPAYGEQRIPSESNTSVLVKSPAR